MCLACTCIAPSYPHHMLPVSITCFRTVIGRFNVWPASCIMQAMDKGRSVTLGATRIEYRNRFGFSRLGDTSTTSVSTLKRYSHGPPSALVRPASGASLQQELDRLLPELQELRWVGCTCT